jgi:signal transduction histidine kinase/CheY-like chemotaxis protein
VLETPTARVPWDDWAALCDRYVELVGGLEETERTAGELLLDSDLSSPLRSFASVLTSPRDLLRLTIRWVGPMLYRPLEFDMSELPDGRLRIRIHVPEPHRGSAGWMAMARGSLRALPRFLDAPEAVISGRFEARGGSLELTIPPSRSVVDRLRGAVRAFRGADAVTAEFAFQQKALLATEASLQRSEAANQAIINALPDLLLILDDQLCIVDHHVGRQEFARTVLANSAGRNLVELLRSGRGVPEDKLQEGEARLRRSLETGEPMQYEYRDALQGAEFVVDVNLVPFADDRLLVLCRDLSERARLQRQIAISERLVSLGQLAAGVAHEVNNPLTYVIANLELLLDDLPQLLDGADSKNRDEVQQLLEECREGANRVREVVHNLSLFSRVEPAETQRLDVEEVLRSAIATTAHSVRHRAALDTDIRGPLPAVEGSMTRLVLVFVNLLVNAGQATESKPDGRIILRARRSVEDGGRVVIEVEDNGPGIDEEVLPRIFEPYFTTKGVGEGTGLGLAISRRAVEEMDGTLVAENRPEGGARFRITLPNAAEKAARTEDTHPTVELEGIRVLVVDDEIHVARAIERMLRNAVVDVADTAALAARKLQAQRYDVVLCDLMMPEVSGMELFDRLDDAHWARERFLFMTGGAVTKSARTFLERDEVRHLVKPFTPKLLRETIRAMARGDSHA